MGRDLNVRKILTRKKTDLPPIAQSCARMERVDFFGDGEIKKGEKRHEKNCNGAYAVAAPSGAVFQNVGNRGAESQYHRNSGAYKVP